MDILLADKDFTSRVPIETYLRDNGHKALVLEDGLEAAKLIASGKGPSIAIMSNHLDKLRGIDICRFLCAMEKKQLVYSILILDEPDPKMLPRLRQAGIDDILIHPIEPMELAVRLDAAIICMEMRNELMLHRSHIASLSGKPSIVEQRSKELRAQNMELLKNWSTASGAVGKKPSEDLRSKTSPPSDSKYKRNIFYSADSTDSEETPQKQVVEQPAAAPKHGSASDVSESEALEVVESFKIAEIEEELDDVIILPFEFDELVLNVFSGMDVVLKTEIPAMHIDSSTPVVHTWMCLGIAAQHTWLDLFFECSADAAKEITKTILGEDEPGIDEQKEMLSELMNMLQGALKTHLEEKKIQCIQLSIPVSGPKPAPVEMDEEHLVVDSGFSIGGFPVNVYLFEKKNTETVESLDQLATGDFVCVNVTDGMGAEISALKAGRFVKADNLPDLQTAAESVQPFTVLKPSLMTERIGLLSV